MLTALAIASGSVAVCLALANELRRRQWLAHPLHELRGALAAISLATGERRDGRGQVDRRVAVAVASEIERATRALAELDAMRGVRSKARLTTELVPLDRLVERSVTTYDVQARRLGRAVVCRTGAPGSLVRVDRGAVCQALANLLANALEHGAGTVSVTTRRARRFVRIEVGDGGRGVRRLPPVTPLRRWRTLRAQHGHGLAIAARVAELHGGSLTAAPADGGSRLILRLPVAGRQVVDRNGDRQAVAIRASR